MDAPARPAFDAALRELGPGAVTVADVGARWGAADAWFRLTPLARLVGFEPDPVECSRLNAVADPASERFYPVALGRAAGTGTLHVTREPGCTSLYPPSEALMARYPSLAAVMEVVRTESIPLTTLAAWAVAETAPPIDFLKLDTQGSELDILAGAGPVLDACLGVEVEVEFNALYDGQPLFADVDAFLRGRGFALWRLNDLAHYRESPADDRLAHRRVVYYERTPVVHPAGGGRLVWGNAVYFRDRGTLSDRRSLLVLAALLEAAGDDDGAAGCLAAAG